MESVAGLRYCALPNVPSLRISSCFHSARATKPQLSLSHSSLSLPRTFEGRPLHRPVSCMRYGSLHRGTENVPLTAFFPWSFIRMHCSKGKPDETSMECPSSQKGTDEDRQSRQIQDSVKCQQQCYLHDHAPVEILVEYLTRLTVNAKDRMGAYQELHDDIMTVVKALQTTGDHDVAVKILEACDPFAVTCATLGILKEHLTCLTVSGKNRAYLELDGNIKKVVEALQTARNHGVAIKILKAYEPLAAKYAGAEALERVELALMKSLQALGQHGEALEYWKQLLIKSSPYLKNDQKYDSLEALMTEISDCLNKSKEQDKLEKELLKNIENAVKTLKDLKAQCKKESTPWSALGPEATPEKPISQNS